MAVKAAIEFYCGEDVTITDTLIPPTDITGWALQFTLRQRYGTTILLTKTIGAGITVTDATNGVFKVVLASANTASLAPGAYVYDMQRIDSGSRTVLTTGTLTLLPAVAL